MYAEGNIIRGKYRLEAKIGEGGMATVWRAVHTTLQRQVAIKFIDPGHKPQELTERFLREARAAAAVRHRNVVDILDFGTTETGGPFMVMELLVGESLADRLARMQRLDVSEAALVFAQVLSGLAVVHDLGIVHRDLKPENVFLVRGEEGPEVKLLDFGVSRALFSRSCSVQSVLPTTDDLIAGTPHYMSPEQARGLKDVDHRSDLYGVGVMLFEALSGRLPFENENVGDLLMMIAKDEVQDIRAYNDGLPDAIVDLVTCALSKDRLDRFQSAREMRRALLQSADFPVALVETSPGSLVPPAVPSACPSSPSNPSSHPPVEVDVDPSAMDLPRSSRWPWLAGFAALGAAAGLLVIYFAGLSGQSELRSAAGRPIADIQAASPPAQDPVRVKLDGLPPGSTVKVDGEVREELPLQWPRSSRRILIEVVQDGQVVWSKSHVLLEDGAYQVSTTDGVQTSLASATDLTSDAAGTPASIVSPPVEEAGVARGGSTKERKHRRRVRRAARRGDEPVEKRRDENDESTIFRDPGF